MTKNMTKNKFILLSLLLLSALTAEAQQDSTQTDTIRVKKEYFDIYLLTRAYSDHVVLRWAPSEFVPWRYLNDDGYYIFRETVQPDGIIVSDSLAWVKPLSVDGFKQRFQKTDSLAGAAVQLIYGRGTTLDQTEAAPGSMKSIIQVYEEQQSRVGFAMMIAELRPDLAEAMGLMYVDRTVKPGATYNYFVVPGTPDSLCAIRGDHVLNVKLGSYQREKLQVQLQDSITGPLSIQLAWPPTNYSAYDIERRRVGEWKWQQLNQVPYVAFHVDEAGPQNLHFFQDNLPEYGTYEYRIRAYDSFGDKTYPSDSIRVDLPDLIPPSPPVITELILDRPTVDRATAEVRFQKDIIEDDLMGYHVFYGNRKMLGSELRQLSVQLIGARETVARVDVSGLPSGEIYVIGYDKAGNQAPSLPQFIRIEDLLPPSAPANLRANVSPTGQVIVRWSPSPEADVDYYEVYSANDTTHYFMNHTNPNYKDTVYVDSLALGLNQRYIYYKVKAVDYSGNQSAFSETLQVLRPNFNPPAVCRIDEVKETDEEITMTWLQSGEADLACHRLFRRLEGEDLWTLVAVYDADSVRLNGGDRIRVVDRPPHNTRTPYVYAMETFNLTGCSSGLSMKQVIRHRGAMIVSVGFTLSANYDKETGETRVAWETGTIPDKGAKWYYCVYRRSSSQPDFRFLISTPDNQPAHNDFLLSPGEWAEYYIEIQFEDGRRSLPSKTIRVTAPNS